MKTDTPETDAVEDAVNKNPVPPEVPFCSEDEYDAAIALCRNLERQRDEARNAIRAFLTWRDAVCDTTPQQDGADSFMARLKLFDTAHQLAKQALKEAGE